jgi:2-keto-4-pentenoate hydratase/2-oxohepta-3-ene-1,7-dioic acid hydratase in catechol pathway
MMWSLATYQRGDVTAIAILRPDGTLAAPPELKRWATMLELLDDWAQALGVLRSLELAGAPDVSYDALLAPVRWPRKVICAGVNYARHIQEMGATMPGASWQPYFFLKAPTIAVIGPADPIPVRSPEIDRLDWEAELAVVIGTGGRDIAAADALAHVAGYCVANDITARGRHKREDVPADAFSYDWFAAKSPDSSLPLGPGITPAFLVADPQDLRLRLWVNGELQQDGSTADMICPVAELISAASRVVTLEPGDVVATAIDGLGRLDNPVIDALGGNP